MEYAELEHFKDRLLDREQQLMDWLRSGSRSLGSDIEKVRALLHQIKDALERIEGDSYGKCKVCQGNIEECTLEARPEAEVCEDCLEGDDKTAHDEDLKMAGKIQRALLPQQVANIKGFRIAARWLPANQVGGDYYDFLPCGGDSHSRIVVADAMGKGVSAGMVMSNLQGALKVLSLDIHNPGKLITKLNHWLCRNVPITNFVSLLCLCLEQTGDENTTLTYVNAGHPLPILVRKDGSVERLEVTGGVLGVHEKFEYDENKLTLASGDFLTLYTDGITELANPGGEMFEDDRLVSFIQKHRQKPFDGFIDNLINELSAFSGRRNGLADDLTIVTLLKE